MENLITLIVFIIMIVSVVNKFRAKTKPGGKPAKSGGLMDKLNAILQEVQDNIEQQQRKDSGDPSGWDQVMDEDERPKVRQHYPEPDSLNDLMLEEELPPPPPTKTRPREHRMAGRERKKPVTAAVKHPVPGRKKCRRPGISMRRARLRKAIIWSEILGPPVALRKRSGDRM
jgi:hypothetical protein